MDGLIIDPFAGVSGDMFVGALLDLGLSADWLKRRVEGLGLGATVTVEQVDRRGIRCTRVAFEVPNQDEERHLADILALLEGWDLAPGVRERAEAVFRRLARAEARVHGVGTDEVHFHEVGALDSILDVVCVVDGLAELGIRRCYLRPVAVGRGTVPMSHGTYPVPAPATALLLDGLPVRETGYPEECTTPTGAALVAELTGGQAPPAEVVYGRSGFGAGSRDPEDRPNCLRVTACAVAAAETQAVYTLQADIDDQAPEYVAGAREALADAGALDVTLVRVDMKKGRQGVRMEVLAPEASLNRVLETLFSGTSTIGVRYWRVERAVLQRTEEALRWRGHTIRVKRVRLPDGTFRRKPEYDDVAAAARAEGLTPGQVRADLEMDDRKTGTGS